MLSDQAGSMMKALDPSGSPLLLQLLADPPSYKLEASQQPIAASVNESLLELANHLGVKGALAERPPNPRTDLRGRPRSGVSWADAAEIRAAPRRPGPVIGVMGPAACDDQIAEWRARSGAAIAERGAVLLTGGRTGVMEAASQGARDAGGLTVGVLPGASAAESPPNPYVDLALYTGLGEARNWVNVCSSDALDRDRRRLRNAVGDRARAQGAQAAGVARFVAVRDGGRAPTVPRARDAAHAVELAFASLGSWSRMRPSRRAARQTRAC